MGTSLALLFLLLGPGEAAPVSEHAYRVAYRDGSAERHRVVYTMAVDATSREVGNPVPGKMLPNGGRQCLWQAHIRIERQVCHIAAAGETACFIGLARRIPAEELSLDRSRVGSCALHAASVDKDLARLRERAGDAVPQIVRQDLPQAEQALRSLPNVAEVRAE